MDINLITLLLFAGAFSGLISGLFGVGGGIVIIPVALWVLDSQGLGGDYIQHIAIGTSFMVMSVTTSASSISQYRKKAILWEVFYPMAPGTIIGSVIGASLATFVPTKTLMIIFIIFLYLISIKTILGYKPKGSRSFPSAMGIFGMGSLIGGFASLLGVGGGILNVPFMLYCKAEVKKAIGTSAALTWAISMTGMLSYIISGMSIETLPEQSLGFCYLPVAIFLIITTIIFAPIGVKLSHKLPAKTLQIMFGILLIFISSQILYKHIIS